MKLTLKLQDDHKNHHQQLPLLLRAKVPITIFDLPFLSHFSTTTTHPSDISLSLSTNFPTGPSLKLSYATASSSAAAAPPLTLSLKSGTGLFGSPNTSPLVISANFSFNPSNPNNPNPTFSLFFKPQIGSFSLRKSTFSHSQSTIGDSNSNSNSNSDSNSFDFVPLERPAIMKEISVDDKSEKGSSIFKGIQLAARTEMPVAKRVGVNFRWWMSFGEDQMPVLRINKIGIQRIDVVKDDEKLKKKKSEGGGGELDVLKGMCLLMKRELDAVTRVNREMKCELEEMRIGHVKKKVMGSVESPKSGFEQWKSKRDGSCEEKGYGSGKKEERKSGSVAIDVENELQRAIMAAAASS